MGVKVSIAAPLRQYCDKQKDIELEGSNVKAVLESMKTKYPLLYSKLCDDDGSVRKYVNLFLNGVDIKKKENLDTQLNQSDTINVIPAVAGGISSLNPK